MRPRGPVRCALPGARPRHARAAGSLLRQTLPSLRTAEPGVREGRQRLLEQVRRDGFTRNYEGVRITKDGRRFLISGATVWNILDAAGNRIGQAATFTRHRPLPITAG